MRKHLYVKFNIVIAVLMAVSLLLTAGGQPVLAEGTPTEVTHAGPYVLDANNQSMNFDEVWDLTQGDLVLTYDLDMSQLTQPASWPTGWIESPPGSSNWVFDTTPTTDPARYPDTYTPWVEVGLRGVGGDNFNPGPPNTYQGKCGGWMTSESDDWLGSWTFDEFGNVILVNDGVGTQDGDDKHSLGATSGVGEWHYDVEDGDGVFGYDTAWDTVLPMFGSHDSHGLWYDRDSVDQWQATSWENSGINAGRINTGGMYHIEIIYHAIDDGLGVMFARVNGVMQGFYKPSWHGGGLTTDADRYPAGLSFKGDMKQMQVFAGSFAYDPAGWDYGVVTLSDITVNGIPGIADPLVPAFSATIGAGNLVEFDASATHGGMGPYTYMWDFNNDGTVDQTTTEPTTSYTFAAPPPYDVKLTVDPYRCKAYSVTNQIDLPPMGQLTVLKFSDLNANGLFDAGEEPVPGWHIMVYQGDNLVAEGDTDASGQITFTLPVGDYLVKEDTSDDGWVATTGDTVAVTVEADGGSYDSMYASAYHAGGAAAVNAVNLDPYNPPNHAYRLNPANVLGPFDAVQGNTTLNQQFFAVASQKWINYTFAEKYFNVEDVADIEFAEVTWSAWHAEAAKVYLTDAYVLDGAGDLVPYGATDDGIGYYAGTVWNKEGILHVTEARRLEITQGYFAGTRDFTANTFYTDGNFGISGFNLPAEVVFATGITLVDITDVAHEEYNPASYHNVSGTGAKVIATSLDPFAFEVIETPSDGNTDGYDLDAIRVHRPVAFGNMPLIVDLVVEKEGPLFAILGDPLAYTYEVTNLGNTAAAPELTDDKCSPVEYLGGDTNEDGLVDPGETWQYACSYTPATGTGPFGTFFNNLLTNTATVMPADETVVDIDLTNNTDTYSIGMWTLRKDVLLYWEGINVQYTDPTTAFTIELYKDFPKGTEGSIYIATLTITEKVPAELWLSEGEYYIYEIDLPDGYSAARQNWFLVENQANRRDMSVENLIHFDLAVEKSCPAFAVPGEVVTYDYKVTNAGPAAVTPVLGDNMTGTPDMVLGDDGIHNIGDLDLDGKIDAGEEWLYTDEYLVPDDQVENVANIATVHDLEGEVYDPTHWHLGGDSDSTNNSDSCSVPVYEPQISKTAYGSYDEVHDWDVFKSVNYTSQNAFAGVKKNYTWTVRVDETTHGESYLVSGVITIVNPNPNAPMEVTLTDVLDDGSVAVVGPCTGGTLVGNTVTVPASGTATCEYQVEPTGDLSDFAEALPVQVTMKVDYPESGDPAYFEVVTITNGFALNGTYEGWCIDQDHTIANNTNYTANVFSSYEDLPAGLVEHPENFDLVNWIINQDYVYKPAGGTLGNYTYGDVQRAIWELIDDSPFLTSALNAWSPARVSQIKAAALANGEGFVPTCGDFVAVVLQPVGGQQPITIAQVTFASLGLSCATSNTVTAVVNGIEFPVTEEILWTVNKINETASLDDDQKTDWPITVSADGLFTYNDPQGHTCSTNQADYTNGFYQYTDRNKAVLSFDTGTDEASASTVVKCYAPVLSKEATATYDETHTWSIEKSVDPESQSGIPGDLLDWTWKVNVSETFLDSNFAVSGKIFVTNPVGSPGNMTVSLADQLDDGTLATVDCGAGAASVTVAAGATAECGYTAVPAGKTATLNTVTGTFNSINFTATANVSFVANIIDGTVTVTDTEIGLNNPLTAGQGPWEFTGSDSHTCSSTRSDYFVDSVYTPITDTIVNWAYIHEGETELDSDDATTTWTCNASFVDVLKTTNGALDPTKDIRFKLYDASGNDLNDEVSTLNDEDGQLQFHTALLPGAKYSVCESPVPAGYTFEITVDGGNVLTYAGPQGSENPTGEVQCFDFTAAEGGTTTLFNINNRHPGGAPRTPGYWKNWNTCTIGGQAETAAKLGGVAEGVFLLDDLLPQMIGNLTIDTCDVGVKILNAYTIGAKSKNMNSDAAYTLARSLLAARLNQDAGACVPTMTWAYLSSDLTFEQILDAADSLLIEIGFNGLDAELGSKLKGPLLVTRANALYLYGIIDGYNNGMFCTGEPSH